MADPHITSQLDGLDKLTVILYRVSLAVAAINLSLIPWKYDNVTTFLIITALIASTTVHIYDKRFRLMIMGAGIFSAIWQMTDLWQPLASGAALFVFSALAIKEYFCFQLKILIVTPFILASFWIFSLLNVQSMSIVSGLGGALLLLLVAKEKFSMPLHYDIGDKSRYQI